MSSCSNSRYVLVLYRTYRLVVMSTKFLNPQEDQDLRIPLFLEFFSFLKLLFLFWVDKRPAEAFWTFLLFKNIWFESLNGSGISLNQKMNLLHYCVTFVFMFRTPG